MTRPADISELTWERAAILMDQLRHYEDDLEFTARLIMAIEKPEPKPFRRDKFWEQARTKFRISFPAGSLL